MTSPVDGSCLSMEILKRLERLVPVAMTLADYSTDAIVLEIWYRLDHMSWFILGVAFLVLSNMLDGLWFYAYENCRSYRLVIHFFGLGIIYECFTAEEGHSSILFTKGFECIFEAAPFALLQTYIILVEEEYSE